MELWVRSQDKMKLVKVNQLEYDFTEIRDEERHKIITFLNNGCFILGTYKTKERALEVLDEIQIEIDNYIGTMAQSVYEMPKE